ncbi:cytochrome c biogenesis protein ResB [Ferdinandcohnia quinoae]|uniref:Cytochrome c biogenesis protein ResB n=1 Tax=Fredinandcohnia quinoae TaxID=2918902 RepID=A0AAW5DVX7_9BACI|nr:cytochrome c biogenesis protein ResB [Fredinandcohnia sp. SECRCQ15]MCH1624795.1 cytochrome c biogenesis protein ResB [Fredinandcohnia sp. SECRCQ15]
MENVKCECGHVNPHGTIFCEACGKPIVEEKDKKLLDMRYEGSARRSQTYNKTIIDKIWNFFSSVKVGIWIIVITLVASAIGTIYPQEMYIPPNVDPLDYYQQEYGITGRLYYQFGFHNLYGSWWYMIVLASLGISLVICSIDRVVPLYKALKRQRVTRHESFLKRQRLYSSTIVEQVDEDFENVKQKLIKRHYQVLEENGNILAEKGRFSRWGPYVNHVGLIIFLIGAMLRFVPGMYIDETLWLREGETKSVPGTNEKYYLHSDKFQMDVYDKENEKDVFDDALERAGNSMVVKNFQTSATLYERIDDKVLGAEPELKKIKSHEIRVNEPLKHDHYAFYQVDYRLNEISKMSFKLVEKATDKDFGMITINLDEPQKEYDLGNGYSVEMSSYFPDFYFDDKGEPNTKSRVPNNPAFVFKMVTPDNKEGEISFVAIQQNIEPFGDNAYKMSFAGIETRNISGLTVRRDYTLWIIALGGAIFMIGVIQGMYWNHRRIWIQRKDNEVMVAGHTNKNWYGLKNEIRNILTDTKIAEPIDQVDNKKEHKEG